MIAADGTTLSDCDAIQAEFLRHYQCLLGTAAPSTYDISQVLGSLLSTTLPLDFQAQLVADVTIEEITQVVKNMPNNKSPGLDGFTSEFFKATWSITGELVVSAVKKYFQTGQLKRI